MWLVWYVQLHRLILEFFVVNSIVVVGKPSQRIASYPFEKFPKVSKADGSILQPRTLTIKVNPQSTTGCITLQASR